jgi:hypothetical protein
MLEPRATAATLADTTLLAYGSNYSSETGLLEGMGLSAYTIEGEKRFHHFEAEPIWLVETAGSHLTSALRTRARVRLWSSLEEARKMRAFGFPRVGRKRPRSIRLVKFWSSAGGDVDRRSRGLVCLRLITRRLQVQILPPLPRKPWRLGLSHSPILKLGETFAQLLPDLLRPNERES